MREDAVRQQTRAVEREDNNTMRSRTGGQPTGRRSKGRGLAGKRGAGPRILALAMAAIIPAVLVGCGSSGGSGSGGSGKLTVAVFMPFSGPDALFGAVGDAGTVPAVNAINDAGGVLGHKFTYKNVDTRGDPADAVPAAPPMLASTSGLVGSDGPASHVAHPTGRINNPA